MATKKQKIGDAVKKMLAGDVTQPELSEVSAHFFDICGGPRTVAKMLHDEFVKAPAGSLVRARLLDLVVRLSKTTGKDKDADNSLLSDEDLEKKVDAIIVKRGVTVG